MAPHPKRKLTRTRKRHRRAHDQLDLKHLVVCEGCGEYHVAHHVCPNCGTYKGETVVEIEDKK